MMPGEYTGGGRAAAVVVLLLAIAAHYYLRGGDNAGIRFCPAGRVVRNGAGAEPAPAWGRSHNGDDGDGVLRVVQWNAEWLFDGVGDAHRASWAEGEEHARRVAACLDSIGGDIVHVVELESCDVLTGVARRLSVQTAHVYVPPTKDSFGHQTVGLISKFPALAPGVFQTHVRHHYPRPASRCGFRKANSKSSGMTKHLGAVFTIGSDNHLLVVGVHLKARPNEPKSCAQREAQAAVLVDFVKAHRRGRHVLVMGDFNDYDSLKPDVSANRPRSSVSAMLRSELGLWAATDLLSQEERVTWSDPGSGFPDALFDYIFVSKGLRNRVESVYVDQNATCRGVSDHMPLVVELRVPT